MCIVGVGVFCGTMHRGATLSVLMLDQVFRIRAPWLEAIQLIFTSVGAGMGAIGLLILFVGILATGATRQKVYHAWRARVGGRISCAVVSINVFNEYFKSKTFAHFNFFFQFMCISYLLSIAWLLILCFMVIITLLTTMSWFLCTSHRVNVKHECIDLSQFGKFFKINTNFQKLNSCLV